MHRPVARADLGAAVFVMALGALGLWGAWAVPPSPIYAQVGPTAVPTLVGAGLLALGLALAAHAWRGGWSAGTEGAAPPNRRALLWVGAGLLANLLLIVPLGFTVAAAAQFVLVARGFGSRRPARDAALALALALGAWFLFVMALGVNIGAGVLEGAVLRLMGQDAP